MDIKNFRKLVQNSSIVDKLNNLEVTINYPLFNVNRQFKGIQSIYKFILEQVLEWNEKENIPDYINQSKLHFEDLKSKLIRLTEYFDENNLNQFDRNWEIFLAIFKKDKNTYGYYNFLSDIPETDFIIKIHIQNPNFVQGALDFLVGNNLNINNNKEYFSGVLNAYEFKNQINSEILKRRHNEKISLNQIRGKYSEYIIEAEQQLNSSLSEARENLNNHFETLIELKEEKNTIIDVWFIDVKNSYTNWFEANKNLFDTFFEESNASIKANEELYREKLRLEAPAKFWKDRAGLLKKESKSFLNWLILVSTLAALFLFVLLMTLGTGFFETAFSDSVKGIKWSIILITLVSFLAYTIKILAKMTFSSLHLSRDAEEREQLTHFYLALKKDTNIEKEERQLILQSLFSRADTGLLKEDSSPTMPTNLVEKFNVK